MAQFPNRLFTRMFLTACVALLHHWFAGPALAQSTDIASVPMAVSNMVTPNVLVIYDNSQSMDAFMNGTLVSGNNPNTRGNIGRTVMRNAMTAYRTAFNWGLMSYQMSDLFLLNTHAYFMGNNASMVFTNDCIDDAGAALPLGLAIPPVIGRSPANGNRRCLANPQTFPAGGRYITFDVSGDDPNILDVLYSNLPLAGFPNIWALSAAAASTSYSLWFNHNPVTTWNPGDFNSFWFTGSFTPTDAGYLPSSPAITRQVYVARGWGYLGHITGRGVLNRPVAADSTAHYDALQALLGNETNGATGEIKNGAIFTPLRGSLESAQTYFSTSLAGNTSPVQFSCQQNFVMMVTDGLPTGDLAGNLYSEAQRTNTCSWSTATNACTTGAFGVAATEAITAARNLRSTPVTGRTSSRVDRSGAVTGNYDIQTYVVALGDTVANAGALSVMNAMAFNGGTDRALLAQNAAQFNDAIAAISADVEAKVGAAAAVAVVNANVTSVDNVSYLSKYNSGTWTGMLDTFEISLKDASIGTTSLWPSGAAETQLNLRSADSRIIATARDTPGSTGGVAFRATTVSAAQLAQLNNTGSTDGADVLAYIRGDRTKEATPIVYRPRAGLLADFINSEPVVVGAPSATYTDSSYLKFKADNANRLRMVYQGGNGGMLHAFDGTTRNTNVVPAISGSGGGAELWAYVPNLLMGTLRDLTKRTNFTHSMYVDATPLAADVDFNRTGGSSSSGDWRTVLVGGFGAGGRGYYALDITSPVHTTETSLASKVLWEFPNSIVNATDRATATLNMGLSFGKPVIVRTKAMGWVVLLTSGYNNGTNTGNSGGDGLGHLYVVNPKTGDLIRDLPTTGCQTTPATSPCGLAQISASLAADGTVDYVYGGDLNGNLWRFNLTGDTSSGWSVARFAIVQDAATPTPRRQPITSAPAVTTVSGERTVIVGTGLYLGKSDVPGVTGANPWSSQTQTLYGLRDKLTSLPAVLRPTLQQQTLTTSGTSRSITSTAVDYSTKNGWYIDFPSTGERVYTNPQLSLDAVIVTSNIPSPTPCVPGGSSWGYTIDVANGGLPARALTTYAGLAFTNVLLSRATVVALPGGDRYAIARTSDGGTVQWRLPPAPTASTVPSRRTSWRQIFQ